MVELATGREAHEKFAELVRAEEAKIAANDKVAAFDAEMREKGLQLPRQETNGAPAVEVDPRALEFLQQWRRDNTNPTSEQRQLWERDMAQVLSGRRFGETPAQWAERQRTGAPAPTSADPASAAPAAEIPAEIQAITPAGQELDAPEAMSEVLKTGASIGVSAETISKILADAAASSAAPSTFGENYTEDPFYIFDYAISPTEIGGAGFRLDRSSRELHGALRAARANGIGQGQVTTLLKAYFA